MKLSNFKMKKVHLGFTLIELIVVTALGAVLAVAVAPQLQRKMIDGQINKAHGEIQQILIQAREHRVSTGTWPANVMVLIAANRVPASAATSPFGTPYALSVVAGNNLQLTVNAGDVGRATKLAGTDLPFISRSGNTVATQVTPGGEEAANIQFYMLDGSRALTGNMNANGRSINNVGQLNATGNITTTGNLQGSRVTATDVVVSQNGFAAASNPAYILRPDGNSNIRNMTAEDIRANYLRSEGNIHAQGTITANGNIVSAANLGARDGSFSGNLGVTGSATVGSLYSGSTISGDTVTGRTSVNSPVIRATNQVQSDRFVSISNPSYQLTPSGTSTLYDVNMRQANVSYLDVAANANVSGNLTVRNGMSVQGDINSTNNIIAQNAVYSRNGFASLNNSSFIVVPDGTSQVNRINANYLQGGTVSATGAVNAQQFIDSNNPAKLVDPSGESNLNEVTVTGRANVQNLTLIQNSVAGQSCASGSIGVSSAGDLLSCKSGVWAVSNGGGGSTVITGFYSEGDKIPFPVGFAKNQCSVSVSNATNAHTAKPNYFAGEYAEYNATTRIATCGFYDDRNKYARGQCSYTVSCSDTPISTTTGPLGGESTSQYFSYSTGNSGVIWPISGFSKSSCTLSAPGQVPGMSFNYSDNGSGWNFTCSGSSQISGVPSMCSGSVSCTY